MNRTVCRNAQATALANWLPSGSRVLTLGEPINFPMAVVASRRLTLVAVEEPVMGARQHGGTANLSTLFSHPGWEEATLILALELDTLLDRESIPVLFRNVAEGGKSLLFSWRGNQTHDGLAGDGGIRGIEIELSQLMNNTGLAIQRAEKLPGEGILAKGVRAVPLLPLPKKVAVLSYGNISNFGDRLGLHLINRLLPAHAVRTNLFFNPWMEPDEHFDLLILGIGNSLFGSMLSPGLLRLMERCQHTIGIFGTQYREMTPKKQMDEVLDRLTFWWARNQDDLILYGGKRQNVQHLGDWLIAEFPMAVSTKNYMLHVGEAVYKDQPLDVTINTIQEFKRVYSSRLHPYLCALTSAEQVGYEEHYNEGFPTGKFDSLLMDIFGRTYNEKTMVPVDRQAVMVYRQKVLANMILLQEQINRLLA